MTDRLFDRVVAAIGDQYLVEGEIGRGSSGVVYRATDLKLHRTVAIKVLPPELAFNGDVRTRFLREAQTAAQLSHPNIVQIYSVDEKDGVVFFVMALVDGDSVGALLTREGRWAIDRAERLIREVADALGYAHGRGVIHRDVKPDNILVERATGRALVTDFGIARAAAGDARLTATGVAVGTPAYMSPEQALGERELDGRSDVYSLGVVAYHLVSGDPPFRATSAAALLVKHVSEIPRPVRERRPDVPAYFAVAIDRSLAKRPEDRWSNAHELRDALASRRVAENYLPARPIDYDDRRGYSMESYAPHNGMPSGAPPSSVQLPPMPPLPPLGMSRRELRQWGKEQRRLAKETRREAKKTASLRYDDRPLSERVHAFRAAALRFLTISPMLLIVNAATDGFPWFIFPSGFLFLDAMRRGSSIWADGVGPMEAFSKGIRGRLREREEAERPAAERAMVAAGRPAPPPDPTAGLVTPEILGGAYGDPVRRAIEDRAAVREILARLGPIEKDMLPDVGPTIEALTQRVAALATTLHRLDADVGGASLGSLDNRIASLESESESPERERRLALLQRQRASLNDLVERRRSLANQLESASIALQNLRLDLLKLRSSGVSSAIDDVTSATQEARAVSREIGRLLEVADDLRKI